MNNKNNEDDFELEEISQQEKEELKQSEKYYKARYGKFANSIRTTILVCPHCQYGEKKEDIGKVQWNKSKCPSCNKDIRKEKESIFRNIKVQEIAKLVNIDMITKQRKEAIQSVTDFILEEEFFKSPRKDDTEKELFVYNNGIYEPFGFSLIEEYCKQIFGLHYTKQLSNTVINNIEIESRADVEDFKCENRPHKVLVKNGIFNIKEWKLESITPKEIYTKRIKFGISELEEEKLKESSLVADKFLKNIVPEEKELIMLQEFLGTVLISDYRHESAGMCIGNGSNGKGVLFKALKLLFGNGNVSGHELHELCAGGYSASELIGKFLNISDDIPPTPFENSGILKSLTGNGSRNFKRKFMSTVEFINCANIMCSCNILPPATDISDGFFRRWHLIHFPFKFVNKENYENATNKTNLKLGDSLIIEKISKPEFLNSLRDWILLGLFNFRKNNFAFTHIRSAGENQEIWDNRKHSFKNFFNDQIELVEDANAVISCSKLKKAYVEYCQNNNLEVQGIKQQKEYLSSEFEIYSIPKKVDKRTKRVYVCMRFR